MYISDGDLSILSRLAERLRSSARPSHVDYISKNDAAKILDAILRDTIQQTATE